MKSIMESIKVIKPAVTIYLIWCIVSLSFFYLGFFLPENELIIKVFEPVSIIVFILLASFLTMFFMTHIEKHIKENTSIRFTLLLFVFLVFISNYGFVVLTLNKNSFLNALSIANLLFFACIVGSWITLPLKRPAEIVPVCVVVAFADLFSVFTGPTKHFAGSISEYYKGGMQEAPPFVDFLLVKIAVPGFKILMPVFGISDWIIISFLSAAAVKFNMNDNIFAKFPGFLFLPVAAAGLIVSIIIARVADVFIPALPSVVIVFLGFMMIKYPEMRRLEKAELVPMLIFSGILMLLMIII
jgi:hypothetical protein